MQKSMNRQMLEPWAKRTGFRPFRIITTAGIPYEIADRAGLALGESELFYYLPKSDRSLRPQYNAIASIELLA